MKVLVVNESLVLGGAETMAVQLANNLANIEGIEVSLAAAEGPLNDRISSGVRFYSLPQYSLAAIFKILFTLRRIIYAVKPDLIHTQGASVGVVAAIAARNVDKRIKCVITHHSIKYERLPALISVLLFRKFFDFSIAISQAKYNNLLKFGIPRERMALIPNCIDFEEIDETIELINPEDVFNELTIAAGSRVVSMAGRLIPDKRFDRFINILYDCSLRTDYNIVGLIIGEGPERKRLEELATVLNRRNLKILFLGYKHPLFKYLFISDLYLFPSKSEVLPMCLIEASVLGIPIVCSNIPGNNDIVDDKISGLLIDKEQGDYAEGVLSILNDKNYALQLSLNGRSRARKLYDSKSVIRDILHVYKSVSKLSGIKSLPPKI